MGTRVGILGGGQLARMLLSAARTLEQLDVRVLTPSDIDPAAMYLRSIESERQLALGSPRDPEALVAFAKSCDVLTFESEFQPAEELARALGEASSRFAPSLTALAHTQDKLQQKALFDRLQIATSPYVALPKNCTTARAVDAFIAGEAETLGASPVLKWACFGYDGKGTFFYQQPDAEAAALQRFLDEAQTRGTAIFAERRIEFRRELAIVGVHGQNGDLRCYPLVISEQRDGICKRVTGPAVALGVGEQHQSLAEQYVAKVARELPLIGAFALELFESADGKALLVNEMAPRVHNSGHYTIDAASCSQFENHLRAIAGLPLGDTSCSAAFGMVNLIGELDQLAQPPTPPAQGAVHWYEKRDSRKGRKLGHLNVALQDISALRAAMAALDDCDTSWLAAARSRVLAAVSREERK
jgi:5-(carboxyamino)imidazole ribonucleotide synthase